MAQDLEVLEEQAEKLKNAVKALSSFTRSPQQRLDTALSYFARTFRDPPEGEAGGAYAAVYTAIGNPPVGTNIQILLDALTEEDLEAISTSLVDLCDLVLRQCAEVRQLVAAAGPAPAAEPTISEGTLETLIPSRGAQR